MEENPSASPPPLCEMLHRSCGFQHVFYVGYQMHMTGKWFVRLPVLISCGHVLYNMLIVHKSHSHKSTVATVQQYYAVCCA